jgi:hypothetical protein
MITKYYRVRMYVGPVCIAHYAEQARRVGFVNVFEGTEHVHGTLSSPVLETETDRLVFRLKVGELIHGEPGPMWWRDVDILGAV